MAEALLIYNEYADMDAADYADTMEADIAYIVEIVAALGATEARKYLQAIAE